MVDTGEWHEMSEQDRILYPIACVCLLCMSGVCSGMTIGVFSIDLVDMQVLKNTGTGKERKRGKRLVPLLENSNQTLVTLLIANTICMTGLPIMLERMVGSLLALILSVTLLLFFGEVLPQATFVRHNVAVCAALAPLVWVAGFLTFPIMYPLSKILDRTVGGSDTAVTREHVAGAVARALEAADAGTFDGLAPHEVRVMRGAMQLSERKIRELPIASVEQAFMLEATAALTPELVKEILAQGYSRVPVYLGSRNQVIGVLVVKALVALAFTPHRRWTVVELPLREPMRVFSDCRVLDLYQAFKSGQSHLAAVYDRLGSLRGFVTLEDVFELVHQCAIRDEADAVDEELETAQRLAAEATAGAPDSSVYSPPMGLLQGVPSQHQMASASQGPLAGREPSGKVQRRARDQLLVSVYESVRASQGLPASPGVASAGSRA